MARDDMFSWLTQGKKPNQSLASPQGDPQQKAPPKQDDGSTTPPSEQAVYFKQSPIPEIGENVSAIVSDWVNSAADTCEISPPEPQEPERQAPEPQEPMTSEPERQVPVSQEPEPVEPEPQDLELLEPEPQEPVPQEPAPPVPSLSSEEQLQDEQFSPVSPSEMEPALGGNAEQEQESGFPQVPDAQEFEEILPSTAEFNHAPEVSVYDTEHSAETDETLLSINEQQRILTVLTKVRREPKPMAGMAALELAPPRMRRASVVAVKAGGRRVMAQIQDVDRIYAYTLRTDKTYRLEGVSTKKAPRLILDVDI